MWFYNFDSKVISLCRKSVAPAARIALFVVYFWFGILKVIDLSPASALVQSLFEQTIPFMEFSTFLVLFGLFECVIGVLFLIPKVERIALAFLLIHMITTFMPLILLPQETWSAFLVPTLEGQYIIKNILIISAAILVGSRLSPLRSVTY